MIFSFKKTLAVRVGKVGVDSTYKGDKGETIKWEDEVRDLGIFFSSRGDY